MLSLCLLVGAMGFALSLVLSPAAATAGRRWGQVDHANAAHEATRKDLSVGTPLTGGASLFVAVTLPIATGLGVIAAFPASLFTGMWAPLQPHLPGLSKRTGEMCAVLAAAAALLVMGAWDDRRGLAPAVKGLVQLGVALVLVLGFSFRVLVFWDAYGGLGTAASAAASALWFLVVINAINFLDNMNGLAAGVGAVVTGLYLGATLAAPGLGGQWFDAALSAVLFGALLGFLPWNYPRARLFLGDSGSHVLGLLLAVLTVRTTYFDPTGAEAPARWYGLAMPLIVMAVPLYDMAMVTVIRLRAGSRPWRGDQRHFSHRLVGRGLSPPAAVPVVWLATLATGLGGVLLSSLEPWQAGVVVLQTMAVLTLIGMLEWDWDREARRHGGAKARREDESA